MIDSMRQASSATNLAQYQGTGVDAETSAESFSKQAPQMDNYFTNTNQNRGGSFENAPQPNAYFYSNIPPTPNAHNSSLYNFFPEGGQGFFQQVVSPTNISNPSQHQQLYGLNPDANNSFTLGGAQPYQNFSGIHGLPYVDTSNVYPYNAFQSPNLNPPNNSLLPVSFDSADSADGYPGSPQNPDREQDPQKVGLYKTELCKKWMSTGSCRYGTKCQFAHGQHELRTLVRHPLYKTTACKSFQATGNCRYGSRCRFIHNETQYQLQAVPRAQLGPDRINYVSATSLYPNATLIPEPVVQQELAARLHKNRPGFFPNEAQNLSGQVSPELGSNTGQVRFDVSQMHMKNTEELDELEENFGNMAFASVKRNPSAPANLNLLEARSQQQQQPQPLAPLDEYTQGEFYDQQGSNMLNQDFLSHDPFVKQQLREMSIRRNVTHHALQELGDKYDNEFGSFQRVNNMTAVQVVPGTNPINRGEGFQVNSKYKNLSMSLNDLAPKWKNEEQLQNLEENLAKKMFSAKAPVKDNFIHISNSQLNTSGSHISLSNLQRNDSRSGETSPFKQSLTNSANVHMLNPRENLNDLSEDSAVLEEQESSQFKLDNVAEKQTHQQLNQNSTVDARLEFFRNISDPDLTNLNVVAPQKK